MARSTPAVTASTLGAWLIKGNDGVSAVGELIRSGFSTVHTRCLRQTYRTDLIEPGQPVLFWVSGSSTAHPAGIYAQGRTTGRATPDVVDDERSGRPKLIVPVELGALATPVLRRDLLRHPSLSQIEVLRMAAGSNPSFLSRAALASLRAQWPQVTVTCGQGPSGSVEKSVGETAGTDVEGARGRST